MSKNLFITSTEPRSGKSAICLGVMELLLRNVDRVGFFRPLINIDPHGKEVDNDINLISSYYNLGIPYEEMFAYTTEEADNLITLGKQEELLEGILRKYKNLESKHDFVLCEGTDFEGSTAAFEFDINAEIANNLGCPVMLVANAHLKTVDQTYRSIEMALDSLLDRGCKVVATIVNRTDSECEKEIINQLRGNVLSAEQLVYTISDDHFLGQSLCSQNHLE